MVFKMLILLGFFIVPGPLIIHSDIHRSVVDRVDYAMEKLWPKARSGACDWADWCARNALKWAREARVS
jgi:hypothetical protein